MTEIKDLPKLNLPGSDLKLEQEGDDIRVFDPVRKRFVALTPEEWVRQHMLMFLLAHRNYPAHMMSVEHTLRLGRLVKRCDILVFGKGLMPKMIVELKAPGVKLRQEVLDQAVRYNMEFGAPYLLLSNGMRHYVLNIKGDGNAPEILGDIPYFENLDGDI